MLTAVRGFTFIIVIRNASFSHMTSRVARIFDYMRRARTFLIVGPQLSTTRTFLRAASTATLNKIINCYERRRRYRKISRFLSMLENNYRSCSCERRGRERRWRERRGRERRGRKRRGCERRGRERRGRERRGRERRGRERKFYRLC